MKSWTKVKLDRDRRQTYLDCLTSRLEEIQGQLNTRRYKRRDYTGSQIEKARRGNPAKDLVDVELIGEDERGCCAYALKLTFQLNRERLAQTEAMDGRYLLGTNDFDLSALKILTHFKKQEVVERRIKVIKVPFAFVPCFCTSRSASRG